NDGADLSSETGSIFILLLPSRRAHGSLLAFRRHRVDFSLPFTLLARTSLMKSEPHVSIRTYALVFLALLVLTGLTTAIAFLDLGGSMNTMVALAIAGGKELLGILYLMHARCAGG